MENDVKILESIIGDLRLNLQKAETIISRLKKSSQDGVKKIFLDFIYQNEKRNATEVSSLVSENECLIDDLRPKLDDIEKRVTEIADFTGFTQMKKRRVVKKKMKSEDKA